VGEILELASELTPDFSLLIIDDGSTDDTYAAAEELSARYPQITVRRHRQRRGLGPTLEIVRRRVRSDIVILHDGVSAIDPNQVRSLWHDHLARHSAAGVRRQRNATNPDADALAEAVKTHASLARAHSRLLGFQLLTTKDLDRNVEAEPPLSNPPHVAVGPMKAQAGIGKIPTLPRPKFLSALADFALGE
jgi:glycosyltransferase involved in cell wall biosynthesis